MADRVEVMLEILIGIQADLRLIKREQVSQGFRISSIEGHVKGLMESFA